MLDEVSLLHLHFYHSDINEWFLHQFLLPRWLMVVAERARGCHWPPLDGSVFIGRCTRLCWGWCWCWCWLHMKAKHDKKLPGHSAQHPAARPGRTTTLLHLSSARERWSYFYQQRNMFNLVRYKLCHKIII